MDGSLLFINKSQTSSLLTRSKPHEKSKIFSHVQNRRRRGEARERTQPWTEITFSTTEYHRPTTPEAESPQEKSKDVSKLLYTYPTHNASDPFHCTISGYDAGTHAMLHFTFASAAKTTFLAEALAPVQVSAKRQSMRHDKVIGQRLKQCVEDETLMYATLAYGCSSLGWMQGVVSASRPPEFFLGKAIQTLRKRLSQPEHIADPWLPVAIYALAITELWNGIPDMWERCPERYALMLHTNTSGLAASRVHLQALVHIVDKAGGWNRFDPYVLEGAILADKYLAIYELKPPIILSTWDPGVLPAETVTRFSLSENTFPKLGENLWPLISDDELKKLLHDIVQFLRTAHALWLAPAAESIEESWLFFKFQAMIYRLLDLALSFKSQNLNRCISLTTLVFMCSITPYYGAQVGAKVLVQHLRAALIEAMFWEDGFDENLRFWCIATGAMTTESSPDRAWFRSMVSSYSCAIFPDFTDKACAKVLESFLFLPMEQKRQLRGMLL